jgi:hypothetical protein
MSGSPTPGHEGGDDNGRGLVPVSVQRAEFDDVTIRHTPKYRRTQDVGVDGTKTYEYAVRSGRQTNIRLEAAGGAEVRTKIAVVSHDHMLCEGQMKGAMVKHASQENESDRTGSNGVRCVPQTRYTQK